MFTFLKCSFEFDQGLEWQKVLELLMASWLGNGLKNGESEVFFVGFYGAFLLVFDY